MDYQRFISQLPSLYANWGQNTVYPNAQFQEVLNYVKGMTTANVVQLLNFAVECMEEDEVYCEVGCFQGATLIGALLGHPNKMAYAVDNFSENNTFEDSLDKLTENLLAYDLTDQVFFCNQDFEQFFLSLQEMQSEDRIGAYFYDGASDYRSVLMGLLLVKHFLADRALIIVNNSFSQAAEQAVWDFIATSGKSQLLLELPASKNSSFGNGLQIISWDVNQEEHLYESSKFLEARKKSIIQIIYGLELEEKKKKVDEIFHQALDLSFQNLDRAKEKYREVLLWDEKRAKAWHNLGMIYYNQEQYLEAFFNLSKAVELEPTKALYHYSIGLNLEKLNETEQAITAYKNSIQNDAGFLGAYINLGNILYNADEFKEAESIYQQAIKINPEHFGSHLNLGNIYLKRQQFEQAIQFYKQALELKPNQSDVLSSLGTAFSLKDDPVKAHLYFGGSFYAQGKYKEAIKEYQEFLKTEKGDEELYCILSECYKKAGSSDKSLEIIREGIKLYPQLPNLHRWLISFLQEFGFTQESIAVADEASSLFPDDLSLKIAGQLMLPILYQSEAEIDYYRERFSQGLNDLAQQVSLDPEAKINALVSVGWRTNFYLAYQCRNDVELQKQYGELVHKIMAANYPQWTQTRPIPPLSQGKKIRVGYVSAHIRNHNGANWALGWIKNFNKQDFEIYCYHTGKEKDFYTEKFRFYSDEFYHIPDNLEETCRQIIANNLHILVFTDIGMYPQTNQMAGLRLAPIQCTAWGHPVTSGSPTVDYYLSSELMEAEDAQEHYSEQLVRLPNIGLYYDKPVADQLEKTRSDYNLREDAIAYLSPQSTFKYLPQYDYIYAEIAKRVPHAQFAFISSPVSDRITEQFRKRLQAAFANVGLDSEEYCVIVPRQDRVGYSNLNSVSDIFLDTLNWSGGNTTLQAIAYSNLPVVTHPGKYMRGRHSYAFLKLLGVTETIAKSEEEYIEIAVHLGLNLGWREQIRQKMLQNHSSLYEDLTCVTALEDFFKRVVSEKPSYSQFYSGSSSLILPSGVIITLPPRASILLIANC